MDIRALLTVVVVTLLGFTYALKCRNEEDDQHQEEFQEAAKMCMSNLSNWDHPSDNNNGGNNNRRNYNFSKNGYSNYYTGNNNHRNDNNNNNYNSRSRPTSRNQQERERSNNKYRSGSGNNNKNNNNNNSNENNNNNNNNNKNNNNNNSSSNNNSGSSDNSALENIEPCIVHCIFKQMQMLDTDAMPDRLSVTNVMMRGVRDSKVKDFVEEAVDDCFDLLESGNKDNKCEFSKNLALCLEEKGRSNCEDWDTSEGQNKNENNNKNGNSNNKNGYGNNNNDNSNNNGSNNNNNGGNNNNGSNNNRGNNRNNNDNSNYGNGGRPTNQGWGQQISRHIV